MLSVPQPPLSPVLELDTGSVTPTSVFEIGTVFCSESNCPLRLHVRPGDPGVVGAGNWATVNGRIVGRLLVNSRMLCDHCAAAAANSAPTPIFAGQ